MLTTVLANRNDENRNDEAAISNEQDSEETVVKEVDTTPPSLVLPAATSDHPTAPAVEDEENELRRSQRNRQPPVHLFATNEGRLEDLRASLGVKIGGSK